MAAPSPPSGTAHGYSFHPYPGDYLFSHHGYQPPPPRQSPPVDLPIMPQNPSGYAPPPVAQNMAMMQPGGAPHPVGHLPPSPIMHNPMPRLDTASPDTKVLRHIMTTLGKVQSMVKDVAERQEQILDRLSLLEQRVGRVDDFVGRMDEQLVRVDVSGGRVDEQLGRLEEQFGRLDEQCADIQEQLSKTDDQIKNMDEQLVKTDESVFKVLEQADSSAEYIKDIRALIVNNEKQDALEKRLTILVDGMTQKLAASLGEEIQDIKKLVKDTEKYVKFDPLGWNGRHQYMDQRRRDAMILNEEQQKEVNL